MQDDMLKVVALFLVIGLPCLFVMTYSLTKLWIDHREKKMEMQARLTAEKAAQYAAHTERLEQRVRVLERIATDRGVDIADEIERLRTQPLN
jgi:cell division protein FtsX